MKIFDTRKMYMLLNRTCLLCEQKKALECFTFQMIIDTTRCVAQLYACSHNKIIATKVNKQVNGIFNYRVRAISYQKSTETRYSLLFYNQRLLQLVSVLFLIRYGPILVEIPIFLFTCCLYKNSKQPSCKKCGPKKTMLKKEVNFERSG